MSKHRFFFHAGHHLAHVPKTGAWAAATICVWGGGLFLAALTSLTTPLILAGVTVADDLYHFVDEDIPEILDNTGGEVAYHFKHIFLHDDDCEKYTQNSLSPQ